MRWLPALLCLAAPTGAVPVYAQAVGRDPVVEQFAHFCLGDVSTLQDLTGRPDTADWSSVTFPTDYRFHKADINLAWRGDIDGKPYELLIASISKQRTNSIMCVLRTPAIEDAKIHQIAFYTAMQTVGLKAEESQPPHIYKYRGKVKNGRSAQAELASALLVRRYNIHGRLPDTIYMKLSILY